MHRLICIGKRKPVAKTMYQKLETRVLAKLLFPFLIYVLGELKQRDGFFLSRRRIFQIFFPLPNLVVQPFFCYTRLD